MFCCVIGHGFSHGIMDSINLQPVSTGFYFEWLKPTTLKGVKTPCDSSDHDEYHG
jgi:hypothetical protein